MCGLTSEDMSLFVRARAYKYGYKPQCKTCAYSKSRAWVTSTAGAAMRKLTTRKAALKRKYGISLQEYDELLRSQGGVCAICGGTDGDKRMAVDHDHASGKVRGILCQRCNRALGLFKDDKVKLRKAISYLSRVTI